MPDDLIESLNWVFSGSRDFWVLVGARAVYTRTLGVDIGIVPITDDFDVVVDFDPAVITNSGSLGMAMRSGGFESDVWSDGRWWRNGTCLDLMVGPPTGLTTGRGLMALDEGSVRIGRGMELALTDSSFIDARRVWGCQPHSMHVAGWLTLYVTKVRKILDREHLRRRQSPKDGADIFRLLLAYEPEKLPDSVTHIGRLARATVTESVIEAHRLFKTSDALGSTLLSSAFVQSGREPAGSISWCSHQTRRVLDDVNITFGVHAGQRSKPAETLDM